MEESRFWEIIAATKPGKGTVEDQSERLAKELSRLDLADVVGFDAKFTETNLRLYTWAHWGAAEVVFGGCGDDHFTDFRSWVVSRGRDVFERVLADPDALADLGRIDDEEVGDAELLSYVASEVYEEAAGQEFDDTDRDIPESPDDPAGEPIREGDREAYRARYPRLFAMYAESGSKR